MQPRLKNSSKWTTIPTELCAQICEIFTDNFKELAKNGKFLVEGRIYPEEILLRVGWIANGQLTQINFETSALYNPKTSDSIKLLHTSVDLLASLFESYLEAPDTEFPRSWEEIRFEKQQFAIRYHTENSELEAEADKLLQQFTSTGELVQGADETPEEVQNKPTRKKPTQH